MGRNNRQRRQAKARARRQRAQQHETVDSIPHQPRPGSAEQRAEARYAVQAGLRNGSCDCGECGAVTWEVIARELAARVKTPGWREAVGHAFVDLGEQVMSQLWKHGWMPRDLQCVFDKRLNREAAGIATALACGQLRQFSDARLSGLWRAQYAAMSDASPIEDLRTLLSEAEPKTLPGRWELLLEVLDLLSHLPVIPFVQPEPGAAKVEAAMSRTAEGSRVYEKVRALLAKAESTDSDAEAEAFTAKAQQLITRYSIDEARLDAEGDRRSEPAAVRVPVERPYEGPKAELLDYIAAANQCRAVYSPKLGFSTMFGEASSLRSVELLFNSLLVQAQSALTREGSRRDSYGRSRTRSFRQSFLASYAVRIGERLRESVDATAREAGAEAGTDLVPLLEVRMEAADAKAEEEFPTMYARQATRVTDYEGHIAGRAAADRARLQGAEAIASESPRR
ncbi:DUF2786 domain-containing protein [Glycomyces sp. L485]|uniref:DUF2786 domain-containing protein n=1 Tax=Glycomyces sp. L485 TaxID=2909235 RepID=UPI001F4B8D95|nr:DUF2786 domain-containing protein [Glycomyces sp. L485]MCH7231072.1 DUF2786 domain-containing protein [Glycomyces sp. L485]